jgi:hypothetical protein
MKRQRRGHVLRLWDAMTADKEASRESQENISAWIGQLKKIQRDIGDASNRLQELRATISSVKGDGIEEDNNCHIDRSRDERGFSFLMIVAQNKDVLTAKTCFEWGADPNATSAGGYPAILFSLFLDHIEMIELMDANGGNLPQDKQY